MIETCPKCGLRGSEEPFRCGSYPKSQSEACKQIGKLRDAAVKAERERVLGVVDEVAQRMESDDGILGAGVVGDEIRKAIEEKT